MYGLGVRSSLPSAAAAAFNQGAAQFRPASKVDDDDCFPIRQAERSYYCDNSQLNAAEPGITFRLSKQIHDRDVINPVALWGSMVKGHDEGDGWLRAGDRYLPISYNGMPVLIPSEELLAQQAQESASRDIRDAFLSLSGEAPSLRRHSRSGGRSRHHYSSGEGNEAAGNQEDEGERRVAWASWLEEDDDDEYDEAHGKDDTTGGVTRDGSQLSSSKEGDREAEVLHFLCDNSFLQAPADGIAYRYTKDLQDKDMTSPLALWNSVIEGVDEGDGWVKVGSSRYLPIEVNGCIVLKLQESPVPAAVASSAAKEAGEGKGSTSSSSSKRARRRRAKDHYSILGVDRLATIEEIQRAYKDASKIYHPDKLPADADEQMREEAKVAMSLLSAAHQVLSDADLRWHYDRTLPLEASEAEVLANSRRLLPPPPTTDPEPDVNCDFNFGVEEPYFARGRTARVRGGRDGARRARAQLRGKEKMELADRAGLLQHVGPLSPFGGLGIAGLLAHAKIREPFRDYLVSQIQALARHSFGLYGSGLQIVVRSSFPFFFETELFERLRAVGVVISQIVLIDPCLMELRSATRQALREFADWQRASALMSKQPPADIFAFASASKYLAKVREGKQISKCHLFLDGGNDYFEPKKEDPFDEDEEKEPSSRTVALEVLNVGGLFAGLRDEAEVFSREKEGLLSVEDQSIFELSAALRDPDVRFWGQMRSDARQAELERLKLEETRKREEQKQQEIFQAELIAAKKTRIFDQAKRHQHPLARVGPQTWVPTRLWRCEGCGESKGGAEEAFEVRYRCPRGCNVDFCDRCYSEDAAALAESWASKSGEKENVMPDFEGEDDEGAELSLAQRRARARLRARREGRSMNLEEEEKEQQQLEGSEAKTSENSNMDLPMVKSPMPETDKVLLPNRPNVAAIAVNNGLMNAQPKVRGATRPTRPQMGAPSARSVATTSRSKPALSNHNPDEGFRKRAREVGARLWRVARGPHVAVRALPKNTARTLCVLYPGEEVAATCLPERVDTAPGTWLMLSDLPDRVAEAAGPDEECWVLVEAADMGTWLERVK